MRPATVENRLSFRQRDNLEGQSAKSGQEFSMIVLSTGSLYTRDISTVFELSAEAGYDGEEVVVDGRWDSRDEEK
jgi:hypothetical protein